jgi:hypothetical protein
VLPRGVQLGAVLFAVLCPATAGAATYAPVDRPGPALSVPQSALDASLECSPGVDHASRAPVLLVPGTGATPKDNWSWTYEPAFNMIGVPWCALTSPEHANGDIQVNGEYVVNAIRTMYARAGRKIAILGHSQGGMVPRWALRFWPDTRSMVDDVIGFAASNHGTTLAAAACSSSCSAANWQQRNDSNFIKALNSFQETFPGISYTSVYTHTDEIVQPNSDSNGSSSIHGGGGQITNVATQEVCPLDPYEHLGIGTIDPVAYALAVDALDHPGPADPSRVSHGALDCPPLKLLHPGINPITFPTDAAQAAINLETSPETKIPAEPELRCYTLAACGGAGTLGARKKPKCKKGKRAGHKRKKACHRKKHRRH